MAKDRSNKPMDVFRHIDATGGPDACWPWLLKPGGVSRKMRDGVMSDTSKARPYFTIRGTKFVATRLVYELVHGVAIPDNMVIRHTCDNSLCCNPAHFELGTHQQNMDDMHERDRHGLPAHVVRRIRVLLMRGGKTHKEIGELYAVDRSIVTRIANDQIHTGTHDYPTAAEIAEGARQ